MTATDNKRLKCLQKRLDWLRTRVYKADDKDLSYDRAEARALEWAMGIVEQHLGDQKEETSQHSDGYIDGYNAALRKNAPHPYNDEEIEEILGY